MGDLHLRERLAADARVQDRFQALLCLRLPEHDRSQAAAFEVAVAGQDRWTELGDDLRQRRAARRDEFAGDEIGVDDRCTCCGESSRNRRLPRGNAAGQSDDEAIARTCRAVVGRRHQSAKIGSQARICGAKIRYMKPAAAMNGPNGIGTCES